MRTAARVIARPTYSTYVTMTTSRHKISTYLEEDDRTTILEYLWTEKYVSILTKHQDTEWIPSFISLKSPIMLDRNTIFLLLVAAGMGMSSYLIKSRQMQVEQIFSAHREESAATEYLDEFVQQWKAQMEENK